jgi:hypothetical protein
MLLPVALLSDGTLLSDGANIVQFVWPGAFTSNRLPTKTPYLEARSNAFEAGYRLAAALREKLGPGYDQNVQLVGHSLGTVVNAYAASLLLPSLQKVPVFQFTALDRPDTVGKIPDDGSIGSDYDYDFARAFGFHEHFFIAALTAGQARNSNTKVIADNYYSLTGFGVGNEAKGTAGTPIYNHTPLEDPGRVEFYVFRESEGLGDNDHSGVQQWYRWTMSPNSLAFEPGDPYCQSGTFFPPRNRLGIELMDRYSLDPCEKGWAYSILAGGKPPKGDVTDGGRVKVPITPDLRNFTNIHGCELSSDPRLHGWLTCREASSAYAQISLDIPVSPQYLEIRYRFVNIGDGDRFTLLLDDLPVWSVTGQAHQPGEWVTVLSPISGMSGRHMLTVALESQGDVNAVFELDNLTALVGNSAPIVNAGSDRTVEATGLFGAAVALTPAFIGDSDGDPITAEWTGPFGTAAGKSVNVQLPLGTHHIILHASDPSGAPASDEVVVTVRDSTPPSFVNIPADIRATTTLASGATIPWPGPTAVDAVDPAPTVTCAPANGALFPVGRTTVTCTAADAAGNSTDANFGVTLVLTCDADADKDVDNADLLLIRAGNGQLAPLGDPRDGNGDGRINVADVRYCQLRQTAR